MSNPDQLISFLTIVAVFLIILIFTLIGVWFFIVAKQKKNDGEKSEKNEATPSPNATYNLQSIMDFMEFEKLKQIIAEVLNVDADEITMDTTFVDDLGADSLDIFQIIMGIEEEFDIEIQNEDAEKIVTVSDAVEQIKNALN